MIKWVSETAGALSSFMTKKWQRFFLNSKSYAVIITTQPASLRPKSVSEMPDIPFSLPTFHSGVFAPLLTLGGVVLPTMWLRPTSLSDWPRDRRLTSAGLNGYSPKNLEQGQRGWVIVLWGAELQGHSQRVSHSSPRPLPNEWGEAEKSWVSRKGPSTEGWSRCSEAKRDTVHVCGLSRFGHVWLYVTLWTVARQGQLSMGFSREEYWSGLLCPPPGDLIDPGIEPMALMSPALAGSSLPLAYLGSPK